MNEQGNNQVLGSHTGSEGWTYSTDYPFHSKDKGSCIRSFGNNRYVMNSCQMNDAFSLGIDVFFRDRMFHHKTQEEATEWAQ